MRTSTFRLAASVSVMALFCADASAAARTALALPDTLSKTNHICRWSESTGNPGVSPPPDASQRHKHVSIVNWKLVQDGTWFQFYPRNGSLTKFNPELSYSPTVDPAAVYNEMELLDFRQVNAAKPPVTVNVDMTAEELCQQDAPPSPGDYWNGPFLLSVSPLQNAEATNISEHVLVYAPLSMITKDSPDPIGWFVLMIWHVRSADECAQLPVPADRDSCLAILDIANLETGDYATKAPALFAKVKYPYVPTATKTHNGVIHGFF